MLHAWQFLTGSCHSSSRCGSSTGSRRRSRRGQITHTPALFVIDPRGRLSRLYMTQMSYTAVAPARPTAGPGGIEPAARPSARCTPTCPTPGSSRRRPAHARDACRAPEAEPFSSAPASPPRLFLFFATWDRETSGLAGQLDALNRYQTARRAGRPAGADRGRRGQRRARSSTLTEFVHAPAAAVLPGRDRPQRQGRRRLPGPRLAVVRAHLADRPNPLLPEVLNRRLAQHPRAGPLRHEQHSPGHPSFPARRPPEQLAGSPAPLASLHDQAAQLLGAIQALNAGFAPCAATRS